MHPGSGAVGALHDIALLIAAETELERVLARVLDATQTLLGAVSSSVFLKEGGAQGRLFTTMGTGEAHWHEKQHDVRPGGMTERALRARGAITVEDILSLPNASPRMLESGNRAVLAAPLRCQEDVIGVIYANFTQPRSFTAEETSLLETLGAYAATALRNAQLIGAERRARERQTALLEMARAINSSLEHRRVIRLLARHTRELLAADEVSIHRLLGDGRLQAIGQDPLQGPGELVSWEPDAFVSSVLARTGPQTKTRPADDPATVEVFRDLLRGVEVCAAVPLGQEREPLGLVVALWRRPHTPDADELQLFDTIAQHATIALQNARTHEAAVAAARLEGAIKTAQAAAHELAQPLAVVVGYGELMQEPADTDRLRHFAGLIARAANDAARKLEQFQRVFRFVELRFGDLDPILDVERSSQADGDEA